MPQLNTTWRSVVLRSDTQGTERRSNNNFPMASHTAVVALISFLFWLSAAAVMAGEQPTDLPAEIRRALDGREDLRAVRRYLGWATDLHSEFPVTGEQQKIIKRRRRDKTRADYLFCSGCAMQTARISRDTPFLLLPILLSQALCRPTPRIPSTTTLFSATKSSSGTLLVSASPKRASRLCPR